MYLIGKERSYRGKQGRAVKSCSPRREDMAREKFWECQLFIITDGINYVSDLHLTNRKGCRKN